MNGFFVEFDRLEPEFGIRYSKQHLHRLIAVGDFPRPVKVGKRNAWIRGELEDWLAGRIVRREGAAA